jgi:hypothetical protein
MDRVLGRLCEDIGGGRMHQGIKAGTSPTSRALLGSFGSGRVCVGRQ